MTIAQVDSMSSKPKARLPQKNRLDLYPREETRVEVLGKTTAVCPKPTPVSTACALFVSIWNNF